MKEFVGMWAAVWSAWWSQTNSCLWYVCVVCAWPHMTMNEKTCFTSIKHNYAQNVRAMITLQKYCRKSWLPKTCSPSHVTQLTHNATTQSSPSHVTQHTMTVPHMSHNTQWHYLKQPLTCHTTQWPSLTCRSHNTQWQSLICHTTHNATIIIQQLLSAHACTQHTIQCKLEAVYGWAALLPIHYNEACMVYSRGTVSMRVLTNKS